MDRLKFDAGDGKRYHESQVTGRAEVMPYRSLEITYLGQNGGSDTEFEVILWDSGEVEFRTFTGWCDEYQDEEPCVFPKDAAPDIIMAIQEFLGSL